MPITIWTILSLVVSHGWMIKQLHVSNAFLHGEHCEMVYMLTLLYSFIIMIIYSVFCWCMSTMLSSHPKTPSLWMMSLLGYLLPSLLRNLGDSHFFFLALKWLNTHRVYFSANRDTLIVFFNLWRCSLVKPLSTPMITTPPLRKDGST